MDNTNDPNSSKNLNYPPVNPSLSGAASSFNSTPAQSDTTPLSSIPEPTPAFTPSQSSYQPFAANPMPNPTPALDPTPPSQTSAAANPWASANPSFTSAPVANTSPSWTPEPTSVSQVAPIEPGPVEPQPIPLTDQNQTTNWTPSPVPVSLQPESNNPFSQPSPLQASTTSIPDLASTWSPSPDNSVPQTPQPLAEPQSQSFASAPPLPSQLDQPQQSAQPTWMPPNPASIQQEVPANTVSDLTTSPLNNPWTTPLPTLPQNQPEQTAQPTWMPNNTTASSNNQQDLGSGSIPTSETSSPTVPEISEQPPTQSDPAPTDLSHLISNNSLEIGGQTVTPTAPETLIVPSQTNSPVPNLPTSPMENHKGIPIWLIGIGIGLLSLVAGASAYFILGVGQHQQTAVSIPAEITKTTVQTPPPIVATPLPATATQSATTSANFGQFQASPPPKASSAADLLRQRQQQGL